MNCLNKYTNKIIINKYFYNKSSMDIIKYFDFNHRVKSKVRIFEFINKFLNLKNKNIYDIGSGFGHFPLICKYYGGNIVVSSNIPYIKVVHEGELYEKICTSFGLETDYLYVNPNTPITPITLNRRYDVISCIMPRWFHKFSLEETAFFINNIKENVLTKTGNIIIECNTADKFKYLETISIASTSQIDINSSRFFII